MKNKNTIWVVDDERIIRTTLADDLKDAGYIVRAFADSITVLKALKETVPDVVITDFKMPVMDGIKLLKKIKEIEPQVTCILMTAHGSIENAVKAMKLGAYDYILKPYNIAEILMMLERVVELNSVKKENKLLRKQIENKYDSTKYIGDYQSNKEIFDTIKILYDKDSTVLITGETGTGKELLTNIIHSSSHRKEEALVKVSCAILSREIFESEIFGHVKGAFTGADKDKKGRFELADGGTLYLDDIDDVPLDLQVKLLRAIEEREIEKVGSSVAIPVNIRLIASTKKDLRKLVDEGLFREDLFYRLNIFPIDLPPLRKRQKDIKILLDHYIQKFSEGKDITITEEAYIEFQEYSWPGNVRELRNISERLSIIASDGIIDLQILPSEFKQIKHIDLCSNVGIMPLDKMMADVEIASIKCALRKTNSNKSKAARLLGIPPTTLRTKMDKYGLE